MNNTNNALFAPSKISSDQNVLSNSIHETILTIRGKQCILDFHLAKLYGVETKRINESVKRNINRFPEDFCFKLSEEEYDALKSHFATSKHQGGSGGRRYCPYAFTEQGIAMLSAVLRSDKAVEISIEIMKAFVEMRHFICTNQMMFERISSIELKQMQFQKQTDEQISKIFEIIDNGIEVKQKIFFAGQIYDAFSLLVKIIETAKENIVIIDNYVDKNTLNILVNKNSKVKVIIFTTKRGCQLSELDIKCFNSQYGELELRYVDDFHDRFMILDENKGYHIGASLKDAGKKCFAINEIDDIEIIKSIRDKLTK